MKTDHVSVNPKRPAAQRSFGLSHDAWGRLVLIDAQGRRFVGVEPVRAFPITHPTQWISLCDAEGREILSLESLAELAPAVRQTLEDELSLREFIPVIKRIESVSVDSFPSDWEVATDRGPTRFTVDTEEDVRRLGPSRVMITDARRLRYQVPDVGALDTRSRRLLERFL
jgi:Domain of unknown function (DUF1854)